MEEIAGTKAIQSDTTTGLNDESSLLIDFIKQTRQPVFLTGKAGTGKTTLLRYIKNNIHKNLAIVAPTAVAALNAGGATLHSFFQIPFGPIIPSSAVTAQQDAPARINFSADKLKLLRCLELLIIDEISMVRADTLDYVDFVLRHVNGSALPFGGVQVLMIGDLYQLPPVVNQDWPLLHKYYNSPYFFDSQVLKNIALITFELTKVYRQSDPVFIQILNGIRSGKLEDELLNKLNACFRPMSDEKNAGDYVTLTTHNQLVSDINSERLKLLDGTLRKFKASVSGDFPKDAYPADEELMLKVGAQVMFTRNDSSGKKQYYNGRMAKVTAIDGEAIQVRFQDDGSDFIVLPEVWQNVKYVLGEGSGQVTETNAGSFTQYPLRLAWAITIHKSQGLTFDKAIVDVSSAFAHGQAYVALSRCRNLEGMMLNSLVQPNNFITDRQVIGFMEQATNRKPDNAMLDEAVCLYERSLVEDMLDFKAINSHWAVLGRLIKAGSLPDAPMLRLYDGVDSVLTKDVTLIAERFLRQEIRKLPGGQAVSSQPAFIERLQKAAQYFIPKTEQVIAALHQIVSLPWDKQLPELEMINSLDGSLNMLLTKHALLGVAAKGYTVATYLETRHTAALAYKSVEKKKAQDKLTNDKPLAHPRLYDNLMQWRKKQSEQQKVSEHSVLAEKTIRLIAEKAPKTIEQLATIKSIGPVKAKLIGQGMIQVISEYFGTHQLF